MWGADGSKILTQDEGWVWLFATIEHFNSECIGWHVNKQGTRFQALEPVSMALTGIYGGVGPDIARGLELRMDHGSQYLSDHFQNQIKYWGITPSFAFVSQPQTNGVVERFFRTLKEQAIYGRIFRNAEEVRQAVAEFVEVYNHSWRLERLGYMSPVEYRQAYLTKKAA
jgi:transposase InsO family protein